MNRLSLLKNQLLGNKTTIKGLPSFKVIKVEPSKVNDKVKIITMNCPSNLNALSEDMTHDLKTALEWLTNDDDTKVIIITGTGKAFIAGFDIKYLAKSTYTSRLKHRDIIHDIYQFHYNVRKPIIAAVNGICYGGGLEIALSCDIILASEKAVLGLPEVKLGVFPGLGGTQKLTKIVGPSKASEYIMTGKNIPLNDAFTSGLISNIYKPEELLPKAEELANTIASYSLTTLINIKQCIQIANEVGLKQGLMFERSIFDSQFSFNDTKEGLDAFIKKRKALFKDE